MAPDLAGSKHGVNGACELARGGDAGDAPVDALLEFGVVLREPTVGRVADVDHGGLHERVAEPAVGAGGDGAIVDGHPRAGRARSEAGVAHQVLGSPESLDGHRLRGDEEAAVGPNAGDGLEERDRGDLLADLTDAAIEALDELLEPVGDAFVGAHEALLLGPEEWARPWCGPRCVPHG